MRNLDFSSWQGLLSTLLGLALITLIGVGIRLVVMQTLQQRRERENRQINERLRTLIAAYKTLGGSFTGNLEVDPRHLRDLRRAGMPVEAPRDPDAPPAEDALSIADVPGASEGLPETSASRSESDDLPASERRRRVRDAVEAALSDIILLGTEEQVRLAARAATDMVAGRPIHTAELVVSLRNFIRGVLNLEAVPATVHIPSQGPARPSSATRVRTDGAREGGGRGGGGGGAGMAGAGAGLGLTAGLAVDTQDPPQR